MPYTQNTQRRAGKATYNRKRYGSSNRTNNHRSKEYIHPSRFIQKAKPATEESYTPTHIFSDFAMNPLLLDNITRKGFLEPSPIQDQTIPHGLNGRDIVGIANTGTGKTAAFAVPVLHKLMTDRQAHALILAPTRELAEQIEQECRSLAKGSGLGGALLIGGVSMGPQLRDLRGRPQIVIGTPGRVKDHIEQRTLRISDFNIVVLDEVDRMLDMGFISDIQDILAGTAEHKQLFFFSATLDERVRSIINGFATDPIHIMVKTGDTSENVEQDIVRYNSKEQKMDKLHDLLLQGNVKKALVFDETHRSVEKLMKELQLRGFDTDAIHGGKTQAARQKALKRFKDGHISILVATDVAARGIDVADITHVINYTTPQSYSDYVHRIGRAGRAGRLGYALTFIED
jgi:ATP-dependent RNA helicase RhlE